jgi:hypothetical protein
MNDFQAKMMYVRLLVYARPAVMDGVEPNVIPLFPLNETFQCAMERAATAQRELEQVARVATVQREEERAARWVVRALIVCATCVGLIILGLFLSK